MVNVKEYQSLREKTTRDVAGSLGLLPHFNYFKLNNPSAGLPYHNNQHAYSVALLSYQGGVENGLELDELKLLFIASLFHDWNHTGGRSSEQVNLANAVEGALRLMRLQKHPEKDLWTVMFLIYATDNRFDRTGSPSYPLMKQIIADADILQNVEPDYGWFISGLSVELNAPITLESTRKFMAEHNFHTNWARSKVNNALHLIK